MSYPPQAPPPPPLYAAPTPDDNKRPKWLVVVWIVAAATLLMCLACGGILAAIAVPNFMEARTRAMVSRARADLRSIATGLEAYWIDNGHYPAASAQQMPGALTTPIAYLSMHLPDPFAAVPGESYRYHSAGGGWIIWSPGPDKVYDLDWKLYNTEEPQPSDAIVGRFGYDPSNGTVSAGDIFRVKQ